MISKRRIGGNQMRSVLGNRKAVFEAGGRKLCITEEGISVEGKKPFTLSFSEV